jgi:hypothetical protein
MLLIFANRFSVQYIHDCHRGRPPQQAPEAAAALVYVMSFLQNSDLTLN